MNALTKEVRRAGVSGESGPVSHASDGPLPQTELGNRLHLDRSTLGEMLQRMVERKLVERRAHERDRRVVEIILTHTGKSALLDAVQQALKAQEALLSPLPSYLRPVFLKCLQILADAEGAVE